MKHLTVALAIVLITVTTLGAVKSFWPGQVLSKNAVGEKWGRAAFDQQKFKTASEDKRAKMAFSLLDHKKQFIGLDSVEIRKLFGDFDGFYFRDSIPTYVIHVAKDGSDSNWQIVFLLNNDFKVSDIIVHKNN